MLLSRLLGKTLRQPPAEANLPSHQLLVRAGYIRSCEGGVFAHLALGARTLQKLRWLVGHQLQSLAAQEIELIALPGADSTTALVRLVDGEVDSYRQLPLVLVCHTLLKVDQPLHRLGLFGAAVRPIIEIHAYAGADLAEEQPQIRAALDRVFSACGVPVVWAEAGENAYRALLPHPAGSEELARCPGCGYAAERHWATTAWPEPGDEAQKPTEEVATPGCDTIATLAEFLDIPAAKTLKMVFYSVEGRVTCVVIRGDRQVDEAKLARVLGTDWYYVSLEDELAAIGAVGGYASPIGLDPSRVRVVADPSVRAGRNFVSGANRPDYHIRNVNVPRDFEPGEWAELALVEAGDPCPRCGGPLEIDTAFGLVGNSAPAPCVPGAEYLDAEGRARPLWVARWRLDVARLMAAVVEGHHDDHGLIWPAPCAPFDVHLVALDLRREEVAEQAQDLHDRLEAKGFSVLFDDRNASAGVKFNDADLIGIPLRLTVSKRAVKEGLVEAKWRDSTERLRLDPEALAEELGKLRRR
jgi:prolyl-tRNA synthetase